MLVLTQQPPTSAGEADFMQVTESFGNGRSQLPGVALTGSSLAELDQHPTVSGLVFTAQGIAVVSVQEVVGQSGYLFAPANGSWTVGGQMVRLADGGSNPLAHTDAAVKYLVKTLRRGGIDPGYVQSLIAVAGDLSGVAQPETERGRGVVVAQLDAEQFAQALELATVQSAGGTPHLWTTADILAALRILGLRTAGPPTEALTNELIPYSPYVLRPASLDDLPYPGPEDLAARPPATGGPIASMLAAPPAPAETDSGTVPGMALLPVDDPVSPPRRSGGRAPAQVYPDDDLGADVVGGDVVGPRRLLRWLAAAAVLFLLGVGIFFGAQWLFDGDGDPGPTEAGSATSAGPVSTSVSTAPTPTTQLIGGYTFVPGPVQTVKDCASASTSYGQARSFFAQKNCVRLTRGLFLVDSGGRMVAVSVAEITMPDPASAGQLRALLDKDGTGNVKTLLANGQPPVGYPASTVLEGGNYESSLTGSVLRVVETAWAEGAPSVDGDGADTTAKVALGAKLR